MGDHGAEAAEFIASGSGGSRLSGLALMLAVFAFNLLGDALRDVLEYEDADMTALLSVRELHGQFPHAQRRGPMCLTGFPSM